MKQLPNISTYYGGVVTFIGPAVGSSLHVYNSSGFYFKTSTRVLWVKSVLELFVTAENERENSIHKTFFLKQVVVSSASTWNNDKSLTCRFAGFRLLGTKNAEQYFHLSVATHDHHNENVPFESVLIKGRTAIFFLPINFAKLRVAVGNTVQLGA